MGPRTRAVQLAAASAVLAGTGNVAFVLHTGGQVGLAGTRYLIGAAGAAAYLRLRRIRPAGHVAWRVVGAVAGGASPLLAMLSARTLPIAQLSLILAVAPPVLAGALGRLARAERAGRTEAVLALVATAAAGAAAWQPGTLLPQGGGTGFALAVGSAGALGAAMVAAGKVGPAHPVQLLRDSCLAGIVLASAAGAAFGGTQVRPSTVAAAAFIALIPGGAGKVAALRAARDLPPGTVTAILSLSAAVAAAGAWALLGETVPVRTAAAGTVSIAAVAAMLHGRGGGAGAAAGGPPPPRPPR